MSEPFAPSPTLAEIDTRIAVLGAGSLPRCGIFAARRAIARLGQAAGRDLNTLPSSDALDSYARLADGVPAKDYGEESRYLARALALPPLPSDVAERVRAGQATLADAVSVVEIQEHWGAERGRIIGALRALAKRLGGAMDQLPASLSFVNRRLTQFTHADFALQRASWNNFQARVRRAVGLVDLAAHSRLSCTRLTGPWRDLYGALAPTGRPPARFGGDVAKIWVVIEYCYRHSIPPDAVSDATIKDLQADLERRGRVDPFNLLRSAVYAWERLQRAFKQFPQQRLSRLLRPGHNSPHPVPFDKLPQPFRNAWAKYERQHFGPGGIPEALADCVVAESTPLEARLRGAASAPLFRREIEAARNFRTVITYAANAVLKSGFTPTKLEDVLTGEALVDLLLTVHQRQRVRAKAAEQEATDRNNTLRNYSTIFIALARDLGLPAGLIEHFADLRDTVDPHFIKKVRRLDGRVVRVRTDRKIGPRHAERLRQFNDPVKQLQWFDLPFRLLEPVRQLVRVGGTPDLEQVNDVTVALLLLLSRSCPWRRKNYATIKVFGRQANLSLPLLPNTPGYIHVEFDDVKNLLDLDMVVMPAAVEVINFYLEHCRPVLARAVGAAPENPYLFPAGGDEHRDAALLNKAFVDRCWKIGGFRLNMQCQRHLTAKLVLDADPTKITLVQRLLGHKSLKTTLAYYAEINSIIAQREFHKLLMGHIEELRTLSKSRR